MKTSARWLLFEYQGRELVILSKPFKTKKLAEKARSKYPDRVAWKIGIGAWFACQSSSQELVEVARPVGSRIAVDA
jgi:hypothetical protein